MEILIPPFLGFTPIPSSHASNASEKSYLRKEQEFNNSLQISQDFVFYNSPLLGEIEDF